jgi:hypothetical protein
MFIVTTGFFMIREITIVTNPDPEREKDPLHVSDGLMVIGNLAC